MKNSPYLLGIDPSLNSTGIIILDSQKHLIKNFTIKQKKNHPIEQKLLKIRNIITSIIKDYKHLIVTMEDFVPQAAIFQFTTGAFHFIIRTALFEHEIPFNLVHVKRLKKFATENSSAKKKDMIKAAHILGYSVENDDEADALFLALIGWHLHTKNYEKLSRKQLEVILKTQAQS